VTEKFKIDTWLQCKKLFLFIAYNWTRKS